MNADAAGFDHPETPGERSVAERSEESGNQRFQNLKSRVSRQAQNDNAGTASRREPCYVAEVDVQSDKTAALLTTDFEQPMVRTAAEPLAADRGYVVPRGEEELLCTSSEVLVELELHRPEAAPMGTYRSLDISAP